MQSTVLCLCVLLVLNVNSISIKFFEDADLTDLVLESNSTADCNNIWLNDMDFLLVFIKTDTCLMVYMDPNCQSRRSEKILPGMERDTMVWVESFHICNINDGGPILTIDITQYYDSTDVVPNVIHRFSNVCSCVNVPNNVLEMDQWSINNHGNEVFAYFEPDCKESKSLPQKISAGNNLYSKELPMFADLKTQSFGPVLNSVYFRTSCSSDLVLMDNYIESFGRLVEAGETFRKGNETETNNFRVEFYANVKFQGFLLESRATEECKNLPKPSDFDWVTNKIESIITNKCIIVFTGNDCTGESTRIESPGVSDLTLIFHFIKGTETKSFQFCNNVLGGPLLNVDITQGQDALALPSAPKVLQSYQDVCSCQKIPLFIQNKMKWSINNYANSMVVYFEKNCMTDKLKPLWIPAGNTWFSAGVGYFGQTENFTRTIHRVQSFGPDQNSQYFNNHCMQLDSVIIKFEILEPEDDIGNEKNMEMTASKTVFHNNGPAQLTQTYSASKSVHESFQINIGSSLSNMNRVQVDTNFDIETKSGNLNSATHTSGTSQGWESSDTRTTNTTNTWNTGGKASLNLGLFKIGGGGSYTSKTNEGHARTDTVSGSSSQGFESSNSIFQEESFKQGLRTAYESSGTKSTSSVFTATVENTRSFTVSQVITVPPCTEHVVNAYVKVVTNKHVVYRALTKITGKIGNQAMTSAEVRKFMDSKLEYLRDYDANTVLAYSKGNFRAEYGISSYISAEGSTLHDCMARISSREKGCPVCDCSTGSGTKASATSYAHPFMAYVGIF